MSTDARRALVLDGLNFLRGQQLATGEILCLSAAAGHREYVPCPLAAALVYDALAYVDPAAPEYRKRALDSLPGLAHVSSMRWRLRLYLGWEQESDGTWRFYGRHSGLPPDAATTMCAAAALWSAAGTRARRRQASRALFRRGGVRDPVALAHALRLAALAGAGAPQIEARVCAALEAGDDRSPLFVHAAAAAWRAGAFTRADWASDRLLPAVESVRHSENRLAAALSTAALLDLGREPAWEGRVPPAHWSAAEYSVDRLCCAGVAAALLAANAARGIAGE